MKSILFVASYILLIKNIHSAVNSATKSAETNKIALHFGSNVSIQKNWEVIITHIWWFQSAFCNFFSQKSSSLHTKHGWTSLLKHFFFECIINLRYSDTYHFTETDPIANHTTYIAPEKVIIFIYTSLAKLFCSQHFSLLLKPHNLSSA